MLFKPSVLSSILQKSLVASFLCGAVTRAQETHQLHMPPKPTQNSMPLQSEMVSEKKVGHEFVGPPPVPEATGPVWARSNASQQIDAPSYTLDTFLSLAAQNNPTIRQSQLHINSQLGKAIQAGLYPNPTISYIGEQIGLAGTAGEWQGAELEQRFVTAGKLELSESKYLQRAKVAEFLAVAQQYRVCNDVRIHFVKALAARETINLKRELLKNAEDHVKTVREMYNLGQASRADAHAANAMLQQHRLAVMNAENDLRQHLIELTSLAGVDLVDPQLDGELQAAHDLIDFDMAYSQIIAQSPELCAAHAKLREDSITVQRERVEWIPDIVVGGGVGRNFEARDTTANAMVRIEIPLYDRNQGTIKQAEADYSRQQSEIRRTELRLRKMLSMEYGRYLTAFQNVQNYEAVILPERKKAYSIVLSSYKANRIDWEEVLRAYEEYTNARIDYVMHQSDQRMSEILIDGFLLHGGLDTPSGPMPGGHIDSVPKPR